ncbi:uncharacterized protein LOC100277074 [Zea mays]|uniref:Uncharacterized protein n=1 Tax=Zea mays TaxID=4577 RepID=B6TNM8_MAIZE|nr:uncharacterized protein LOC100277074 [Zea mays]ACG38711.1 hypothetical protein [Zea mays]AQK52287.1 hypothetical protein ZEAMMB73_Zm00001d050307 [Zea mays]|eukprot:NP_001144213.1 uncharacterized protein LOC100277074 [Zea mays]
MSLSRFSQWIWPGSRARNRRGRDREPPAWSSTAVTKGLFPDSPSGFREPDAGVGRTGMISRRGGRAEDRVDSEHGMVIVQSDGDGCLSDSDSDASDWSIGWLEPLAPDLHSDVDSEGSFAVLVPCYRRGRVDRPARPDDNRTSVEQWVSSLQN